MTLDEMQKNLKSAVERRDSLASFLAIDSKIKELAQLEMRMSAPDFWDDNERARKFVERVQQLKNTLSPFEEVRKLTDDFVALAELVEMEGASSPMLADADGEWEKLFAALERMELLSFLSGKYDNANCFLTINAGAGGTESCDWASMLLRMYTRWIERRGFKQSLLDIQEGEEAGVKSATILVEGEFANGFLKAEKGVHRLVRISPFDANKRRHTSFVSIDIMPEFPDNAPINIETKDLRIDTYRASGAGGQHVNRTDSAVRITHLPTGIVVSCQMQRDQHKNKDMCMKMLAAKLEELAKAEQEKLAANVGGEKTEIGWGRQIRSYVLDDRRVKDLRTGHQTSNTEAVLDGDLDPFINAYLRSGSNQNAVVSDD
ncbi:MAG: hypothetical protein RL095_203 [Verrucomicrobiota bacterium]|jgi:peptide chain release factor 2